MQSGILGSRGLLFVLACATLGAISMTGCKKVTPAAATPPSANPTAGNAQPEPEVDASDKFAAGKTIFRAQCARCHQAAVATEQGGKKGRGGKGPNLATVGGDPKHTKAWLTEHINDPKSHHPQSGMPKFAGRIKDDDMKSLVDYLASLK
jgi:mono/diheme cytochrome c family protein